MYAALWRILPGPLWLRIILLVGSARDRVVRPGSVDLPVAGHVYQCQ